ncbi:GL21664 [Drosophila persimilis]|uniref:Polymerase delta-interacting protein 2 n=2 Tax=pseudoobscura subgroup TaxID=32358 RepID=A0A6I8UQU7_DROPS|nr:polymerase delta-interacting protein 2 [Drosophila pseudoobscura]XP_002017176.1 polymerase delta-interacting protein 2 [Drosophila persimilis]EDW34276.1 GL21664 [Drosophila persimilis]
MGLLMQVFQWERRWHLVKRCDVTLRRGIKKNAAYPTKLAEVGRLVEARDDKYETGQVFLHRIFGYRGVILFPWTARVYDRDLHNPSKITATTTATATATATATPPLEQGTKEASLRVKPTSATSPTLTPADVGWPESQPVGSRSESTTSMGTAKTSAHSQVDTKEVRGKVQTFYQVLIDTRDCPHIRAQTEAVTFLGNQDSNRSLYAIPGLDYVAHEDIMPYSSTEKQPLQHELFDKFLTPAPDSDPPFVGQDTLKAWQEKNHPWLDMSDVHKETTENVRITVIPFYMGCRETPASSVYWWRYCIRLENLGELSVQLRERHWRIFSLSGTLETVRGRGVVGQEPILSPRLPAFQYSSHVSLQAPSGHMWGTFRLEREDGYSFDCKIPPFSLESKPDDISPPTSSAPTGTGNTEEYEKKRDDTD